MSNLHHSHPLSDVGAVTRRAWWPVPVLLAGIIALWVTDPPEAGESRALLIGLHFTFSTVASLLVAYLLGRSFLLRGSPGLLVLGSGTLIWGLAGLAGEAAAGGDANIRITVYNCGVCLSAACQLAGVALPSARGPRERDWLWLGGAYLAATGALVLIAAAGARQALPTFFVEGQGGTLARQVVVGAAVGMFGLTALLLATLRHRLSRFGAWYSIAMALIATGMFGMMVQTSSGSWLSWASRSAQFLGGIYMLVAAISSVRESSTRGISLERALSEAKQEYEDLLQLVSDGVVVQEVVDDPEQGRFIQANPAACHLLGYSFADLCAVSPTAIVAPEHHAELSRDTVALVREGALRHEKTLVARDGRRIRAEISARLFRREGRTMVISVIRDVTERKRIEEKLRQSERLYRAIGETIEYGVWVCAPDGRNIYASESFLKLVGLSQEQCSNFGWGDVLHPEDAERTIAAWKECVRTGGKWDIEHRFRGVDGKWHDVLARGVPVRDDEGQIVCWAGINLDISAMKNTQEALRAAKDELARANVELEMTVARRTAKLQETISELEHFSYAIIHDMRAPLRAMQGFSELAEEEYRNAERPLGREYLRKIQAASRRMDQLITDSLKYSRTVQQQFALEPVVLRELVQDLVDTYPNLQSDKAEITVERNLPIVFGNEAALTQCFSNLLGNAVKFAKPGIKPQIKVRAERLPRSAGSQPAGSGSRVRIWVEDNGIGIAPEAQTRIFGMFQRATREHEGTGIGLAIVRKVARQMGGEVGVESEEGKGSRFWLELREAEALVG